MITSLLSERDDYLGPGLLFLAAGSGREVVDHEVESGEEGGVHVEHEGEWFLSLREGYWANRLL